MRYLLIIFISFFFSQNLFAASSPFKPETQGDTLYIYNENAGTEIVLIDSQYIEILDFRNQKHTGYITSLHQNYIELNGKKYPLNTIEYIYYKKEVAGLSQVAGGAGIVLGVGALGIGVASAIGLSDIGDPSDFGEILALLFLGPILLMGVIGGFIIGFTLLFASIFNIKRKPKTRIKMKKFRLGKMILSRLAK